MKIVLFMELIKVTEKTPKCTEHIHDTQRHKTYRHYNENQSDEIFHKIHEIPFSL